MSNLAEKRKQYKKVLETVVFMNEEYMKEREVHSQKLSKDIKDLIKKYEEETGSQLNYMSVSFKDKDEKHLKEPVVWFNHKDY